MNSLKSEFHCHNIFSNGNKYEGEWRRNQIWNGKYYEKKGEIIGIFTNGIYNTK